MDTKDSSTRPIQGIKIMPFRRYIVDEEQEARQNRNEELASCRSIPRLQRSGFQVDFGYFGVGTLDLDEVVECSASAVISENFD